tara:strand:- start:393 stop:605 length:213 start_codon:yes stop_codon:yes gene_type:complete
MSELKIGDRVVVNGNQSGVVSALNENNQVQVTLSNTNQPVWCESTEVVRLLLETDWSDHIDPNTPSFLSE